MNRLLYVVGTGFTGSTLFAFLLNGHPQIASVGEATGPIDEWEDQRSYTCSCGATLEDCEFWRRMGEEMRARGFEFGANHWNLRFEVVRSALARQLVRQSLRSNAIDRVRDALVLRVPGWGTKLREIARRNEAFVASALAVTGKGVFLDASKDAVRARYLHRLTDLDVHVVHLVRDSLGAVSSYMKNRGAALPFAVRYWNRTANHARRLAAILAPDRFLRVRYEDLCTHTEEELARVARFVGVDPSPGPIDFRGHDHHIIGNPMRLASSREVTLDESWRERLSAAQVDEIRWRTGANRRLLGYE